MSVSRSALRTSIVAVGSGALLAAGMLALPTSASSAPQASPRNAIEGNWSQVGAGFSVNADDTLSQVFQLISRNQFPDLRHTPGPIYAAGTFTSSGGTTINRVAQTDGNSWVRVSGDDTGIDPGVLPSVSNSLPVPGVYGLVIGGNSTLYAGGVFTRSDDTLNNVAKWTGSGWRRMGFGLKQGANAANTVQDMVMGNDFIGGDDTTYSDDTVYAVGGFVGACLEAACSSTRSAIGVAQYSQLDDTWLPVGDGIMSGGATVSVFAGAYIDDTLYVGGTFSGMSGKAAQSIAQWSNADDTWTALGGGMTVASKVYAMAVHPITKDLYIGGYLIDPSGYPASFSPGIVKWDYSDDTWAAVGTGLANPNVDDIAFSPDGTTMWIGMDPALNQAPVGYVAQLTSQDLISDGATTITGTWNALTSQGVSGVGGPAPADPGNVNQQSVRAAYALGNNSAIFGGNFHTAGPISVGRIARFSPPPPPPPVFPPGAPTGVTATGEIGSVTVSWNAPADSGGLPIRNYRATASPGGATCEVDALTCAFTGLTVGTQYTFTVQAYNFAGWGPASAPSNAASPLDPPPPPPPASISIGEATRVVSGRGTEVSVTASTVSIAAGTPAVPWTRIGRGEWTPSPRSVLVGTDGTIAWKRKFGANRNRNIVAVKFVVGDVQSSEAILRPVR